jgi:hypothetical protein
MVQSHFAFLRINFYLCDPNNGYHCLLAIDDFALTIMACFRLSPNIACAEADSPGGFEKAATVEFHGESPIHL